MTTIKHHWQA